ELDRCPPRSVGAYSIQQGDTSAVAQAEIAYERSDLHQPLIHHRIRYLKKTRNICAVHIIAGCSVFLGSPMADGVNALHDLEESRVYFFARPGDAHAILRHFQAGGSNAARVCRFARAIKNSRLEKTVYPLHR